MTLAVTAHSPGPIADHAAALLIREAARSAREVDPSDLLRQLMAMLPVAVYTCDREGRIALFNERAVELWGRRPEPGVDLWCGSWRIQTPDGEPLALDACPMAIALREGRPVLGQEIVVERPDGSRRRVMPHPEPLRNATGEVVGAVNVLVDLTSVRETEAALRRIERDAAALRDASLRADEYLGVLSHEIRNPLGAMQCALALLDGPDGAATAREILRRQMASLGRLVDDLLDATAVAKGKVRLRLAPVDLAELARRTAEDHQPALAERGIALEVRSDGAPLWIRADAVRIAQVIGNLLQNARKFTPAGGRVEVTALLAGDGRARVAVRDDGVGIAPELLERIFEPFMQVDATLDRTGGGLGLGLAVARQLVGLHGGTLEARSPGIGRGAELVIHLPLEPTPAAEVSPRKRTAPAARRVLVVDDNVDLAESMRAVLASGGHDVRVAHDAGRALEVARAFGPELVFSDIGLPGRNGYALARAFREDHALAGAVLVAVTGYARPRERDEALRAGFDRHLSKPVTVEDLRDAFELIGRG